MITINQALKTYGFYTLILFLSLTYLFTAFTLGAPILNGSIEPSFFPLFLGGFASIFSSLLLYKTIVKNRSTESTESTEVELKEKEQGKKAWSGNVPTLVMGTAIYIGLFTVIGYFLSSILYVFFVIIIFSDKNKFVHKFIISLLVVSLGYLIFEQLFGVRLPTLEV